MAAIGMVISLEAHQYYIKVPTSSYDISGGYTVTDNLLANPLYNQSSIENPQVIYNGITSSINLSAQVFIELSNMSVKNFSLISQVSLASSSPSWEKLINTNITYEKVSTKGAFEIPIRINLSKELALADNIDIQLQDGSSVPVLDINLSVVSQGLDSFSASISMALHSTYEVVTYDIPVPISVSSYNQELVTPHTLIGLDIVFGYIFLAGAGLVGVVLAVLYKPRHGDPLEKIKKDHGEQIIEINTPPEESAKNLMRLEDILKISEIFEVPVFLYVPDRVFFVSHQGEQYKYELI